MKPNEIIKIIQEYGLKPASQRDLSLFTLSVIALSYVRLLKKELGFSYIAMGAIGKKNKFHTLLNEDRITKETGKFIESNFKNLDNFLKEKNRENDDFNIKIKKAERSIHTNPEYFLKAISRIYPNYMLIIGIYNCFWRYIGNEKSKGKLSEEIVKRISDERGVIAKTYPEIEKKIQLCVNLIGRKNKFDGDLLRYLTIDEMMSYLNKKKKKIKSKLKELKQRRDGYFYLFTERKESISTDKDIIKEVYNKFFKVDTRIDVIKGHAVYPGKVKGRVYNLTNDKHNLKNKFILVASMTHPKDIVLIGKSLAIVTDEGGILSHAAIIAREMKKPCIIGTKIATKVFKDGDLVEVDANKGVVRKIEKRYQKSKIFGIS